MHQPSQPSLETPPNSIGLPHASMNSVGAMFGDIFDKATKDPSRLFYVPARWAGSYWRFQAASGAPLAIDEVVQAFSSLKFILKSTVLALRSLSLGPVSLAGLSFYP